MVLGVDAPKFPFKEVLRAQEQNQGQGWEQLQGLVPDTLGMIMQAKKQQQWKDVIGKMIADPNTSPALKQFAPLLASYPDLGEKVLPALIRQSATKGAGATMDFDPTTGTWSMPAPPSAPTASPSSVPPIPSSGTTTTGVGGAVPPSGASAPPTPPPSGKQPIKLDMSTPGGRAMAAILDRQGRGKLSKEKADASMIFAKARMGLKDLAVSKELSRTMNPALAPSGSALGKVAFTNIRSGRNIQTISKGPVTWAQVSNALSDIAGAYHGGAPFVQEYMNQGFPNINQDIAKWTTFVTGTPVRNVPEPIRQELVRMSQALLDLDSAVLTQNAQTQGKLLKGVATPQQIQSGIDATKDFITSSSGGGKSPSGWDAAKEQRYQQWKQSQGMQ